MKWIDVKESFPEEGLQVLCVITKFGQRTIDESYNEVIIDKEGKKWRKAGEQITYELLWREKDKWVNWEKDNYEDNFDYMAVIAWSARLDYKLKKDKNP